MPRATVAFVESATQLINVAEWAYGAGRMTDLRIDVLPPNDPFTIRQIEAVAELVRPFAAEVRVLAVRNRRPGTALAVGRAARDLAGATTLVVGDPFSRFVQLLLPLCSAEEIVVVDDGTATWQFVDCINAGAPLVRWDAPAGSADARAVRAGLFYAAGSQRRVTVFSCLSGARLGGSGLLANNYAWSRSWRRPEVIENQVDVLGVSLVGSGVVRRHDYVQAVADLAHRFGAVRYLPHRREDDTLVAEIAALPGVTVQRLSLPVELALRQGPVGRHIVTFPSTASHTLPLVLADLRLRIEVQPIAEAWFTPQAAEPVRAFVRRIADSAPLPPVGRGVSQPA